MKDHAVVGIAVDDLDAGSKQVAQPRETVIAPSLRIFQDGKAKLHLVLNVRVAAVKFGEQKLKRGVVARGGMSLREQAGG